MSDNGPLIYFVLFGLLVAGSGLYAILRSDGIARRNRAHVESGKDGYFEERRAWRAYPSTRPLTDPVRVRRWGWIWLIAGLVPLLTFFLISLFQRS